MSSKMRVLVACEFSGMTRNAFQALGHEAWSCDLLEAEDGPTPFHIQDTLEHVIGSGRIHWDLLIAHPPCTYLANSGARWLYTEEGRFEKMKEAAEFFRWILELPIARIAVENPVMHKHALEIVGRKPQFTVQPWQFGDPHKKRTCFWANGVMPLIPTINTLTADEAEQTIWRLPPGPDRWKERSRTYPGIAKAMADQWGGKVDHA